MSVDPNVVKKGYEAAVKAIHIRQLTSLSPADETHIRAIVMHDTGLGPRKAKEIIDTLVELGEVGRTEVVG